MNQTLNLRVMTLNRILDNLFMSMTSEQWAAHSVSETNHGVAIADWLSCSPTYQTIMASNWYCGRTEKKTIGLGQACFNLLLGKMSWESKSSQSDTEDVTPPCADWSIKKMWMLATYIHLRRATGPLDEPTTMWTGRLTYSLQHRWTYCYVNWEAYILAKTQINQLLCELGGLFTG